MTLKLLDRRTGSTLRRALWGLNPLEKALVIAAGAAGAFGMWLVALVWFGLFCGR